VRTADVFLELAQRGEDIRSTVAEARERAPAKSTARAKPAR
jgi:hypothetical protein